MLEENTIIISDAQGIDIFPRNALNPNTKCHTMVPKVILKRKTIP
jgi:rRNA-processing protein FCF1